MIFLTCSLLSIPLKSASVPESRHKVKFPVKPRIQVAIVDSGYNKTINSHLEFCDEKLNKDFTDTDQIDNYHHGSHIGNIISNNLYNNVCFIILKAFNPNNTNIYASIDAFVYANIILRKGDVLNYSAGGPGFSYTERALIKNLLDKGIHVFVAAGNSNANLDINCNYFPACYHLTGLNVIGNGTPTWKSMTSNYGRVITEWEDGQNVIADNGTGLFVPISGTSQSTAIASRKYLEGILK